MPQLLGEYECKVDSKGRMRLPSQLVKQLGTEGTHTFIINRGMDNCLMLYPKKVWDVIIERVNRLNIYNKKNRDFVRFIYRGATELVLDGSDRLNLPNRLSEYAGIEKDVILFAINDRIEVWSKAKYDQLLGEEPEQFSDLAEEVMGQVDWSTTPDPTNE